jgi:hypothetical protein
MAVSKKKKKKGGKKRTTEGTNLVLLKKLSIELPCGPPVLLLSIYIKELKVGNLKYLYIHVHSSVTFKSQRAKTAQLSSTLWDVTYP